MGQWLASDINLLALLMKGLPTPAIEKSAFELESQPYLLGHYSQVPCK